jgi:hypothetical protein
MAERVQQMDEGRKKKAIKRKNLRYKGRDKEVR